VVETKADSKDFFLLLQKTEANLFFVIKTK